MQKRTKPSSTRPAEHSIHAIAAILIAMGCGGNGGSRADAGPSLDGGTDAAEARCGNGILEPDEACDDGSGNSDTLPDACRTWCKVAHCGDGVVDSGEACDDGDGMPDNECNNECSGGVAWTRKEGGIGWAEGVASDSARNVIVVGSEFHDGEGTNVWVRKYDPDGGTIWTRQYNGASNGDDAAWDVACDGDGNVAVVGWETVVGEGHNVWLRKYDPQGAELWTQTFDDGEGADDEARGVAADLDGSVVVVGYVGTAGGGSDIWVRKYDALGAVAWTRTHGGVGASDDWGASVAVDVSGAVIVTGAETLSPGDEDVWIREYDANGVVNWTRGYGGAGGGQDWGTGVAVDSDGNVLVSGVEGVNEDADGWVRKYDPSGLLLWTRTYADEIVDYAWAVSVSDNGDSVACGYDAGDSSAWLRRYTASGETIWTQTYDAGTYSNYANGVAHDGGGNVLVVGVELDEVLSSSIWVRKYTP